MCDMGVCLTFTLKKTDVLICSTWKHTWMSQEVSKWLVNGLYPQYTPFISRLVITHLQPFTIFLGHPSSKGLKTSRLWKFTLQLSETWSWVISKKLSGGWIAQWKWRMDCEIVWGKHVLGLFSWWNNSIYRDYNTSYPFKGIIKASWLITL